MFIAVPQDQFISAYNRELSRTDLHGHMNWYEVLTGRCRLYFDIDKITFERFFDILSWMRHNFPRETWRIFIRESDTQSFHIIGSTVYENPMHVGYAVAQKNPPGGIDMAVYTVNRCWKLPYSRKFGKGAPMVHFDVSPVEVRKICAEDLVAASAEPTAEPLRLLPTGSCTSFTSFRPKVEAEPLRLLPACSLEANPAHLRQRRELSDHGVPTCVLVKLRDKFGPFYDIRAASATVVRLSSVSRKCSIAGREHRHNHIFVLYDLDSSTYAQSCFNKECQGKSLEWKTL